MELFQIVPAIENERICFSILKIKDATYQNYVIATIVAMLYPAFEHG